MPAYLCPKGHSSEEPDFCSECGAKIQAAPAVAAPALAAACPDCGGPRPVDGAIFCEVCGYNFESGAHGDIQPPPAIAAVASAKVAWTALVAVDPSLREAGSPDPPVNFEAFTVALDKPVNLIGRTSTARAIHPEIALDHDEAVSHRHALLTLGADRSLTLRDIGSSNGTRLTGSDVPPLTDVLLNDGAQIALGHWTLITIKAAE